MTDPSPTLATHVRKSAVWSGVSAVAVRTGSFAVGIAAARLVAPREFGVFAVALTAHAVIVNVSDIGVSAYLVRHPGNTDRVAPIVVTISLVTSAVLAALLALAAPLVASALGAAEAAGAIRVLSLTLLLAGLSAVPNALLVRTFRQDKRFLAEGANFVVSSVVLVALALADQGALALAWSRVAGLVVSTALLIVLAPRRYRPGFDRTIVRTLLGFGLPLAAFSFVGFAVVNIDYVVVGRMMGAELLGLYVLAYNISGWPYGILSPIISNVAMPAFARLQDDRERLPLYLANALAAVCAVALPISALLMGLAGPLIHVAYGPRWSGAITALVAVALYGAIRIPAEFCIHVNVALGRTRELFLCNIAYLAVLLPATIIGVRAAGIVGAGLAHIVGMAAAFLPGLLLLLRQSTGVRLRAMAGACAAPAMAAVAAGVGAHFVALAIGESWSGLLGGLAAGGVIYLTTLGPWLVRTFRVSKELWSSTPARPPEPEAPPALVPLFA